MKLLLTTLLLIGCSEQSKATWATTEYSALVEEVGGCLNGACACTVFHTVVVEDANGATSSKHMKDRASCDAVLPMDFVKCVEHRSSRSWVKPIIRCKVAQ